MCVAQLFRPHRECRLYGSPPHPESHFLKKCAFNCQILFGEKKKKVANVMLRKVSNLSPRELFLIAFIYFNETSQMYERPCKFALDYNAIAISHALSMQFKKLKDYSLMKSGELLNWASSCLPRGLCRGVWLTNCSGILASIDLSSV